MASEVFSNCSEPINKCLFWNKAVNISNEGMKSLMGINCEGVQYNIVEVSAVAIELMLADVNKSY
jgi:hypothetical protein